METKAPLTRRDLWLLPLLAILTAFVILGGAELGARAAYPEQKVDNCFVNDQTLGHRVKPNCVSRMKTAEGPWYTNVYNDCGYRSATSCGPVPAGVRRIAFVGSSITGGYLTPFGQTVAGRLQRDLTRDCHAAVDVQNLGGAGYSGNVLLNRMDEALKLHPQAVVNILLPFDVEHYYPPKSAAAIGRLAPTRSVRVAYNGSLFDDIRKDSRFLVMVQHFMLKNPSVYIPMYLKHGDSAGFLSPTFSDKWNKRLALIEAVIAGMADRAHQSHTAFIIVLVPHRAQALLMASRQGAGDSRPSAGPDPDALIAAMRKIALRHGAIFVDAAPMLVRQPNLEDLYYVVDGHLDGDGQSVVADGLARAIETGAVPAFRACEASKER